MKIVILGGTSKIGEGLACSIESLRSVIKNQIVISIVVPMKKDKWFEYTLPEEGCVALRFQSLLPGVKSGVSLP